MKKILALLLVAVMCLSFVACGNEVEESIKVEEAVIGDWVGDFTYNSTAIYANGNSDMCIAEGHKVTTTLSIFKGQTIQITLRSNETGFESVRNGTWEINDGVLVITQTYGTAQTFSFVIDTEVTPNILTLQGSSYIFPNSLSKK